MLLIRAWASAAATRAMRRSLNVLTTCQPAAQKMDTWNGAVASTKAQILAIGHDLSCGSLRIYRTCGSVAMEIGPSGFIGPPRTGPAPVSVHNRTYGSGHIRRSLRRLACTWGNVLRQGSHETVDRFGTIYQKWSDGGQIRPSRLRKDSYGGPRTALGSSFRERCAVIE